MYRLARMVLRPALRVSLAGTEAPNTAACSWAASQLPRPACIVARHWSSSAPSEEALRKAERMVDLMAQSPQLQQMILNVLPSPLRNPDILKQMFADPTARRRITEMLASRGFSIPDHMLDRMTPGAMGDTFARAQRLGVDPSKMFATLMAHPGLLAKLQQPRVMAAFLDIAEDPSRQAKYEGDKELLEVVFKAREILGSAKATPATPSAPATVPVEASGSIPLPESPASSAPADTVAATEAMDRSSPAGEPNRLQPPPPGQPPRASGVVSEGSFGAESTDSDTSVSGTSNTEAQSSSNPLVALMRSDPKAARWLDNPTVMNALEEINRSPWKTVKYILNRDVMAAFKDLNNLIRGKQP